MIARPMPLWRSMLFVPVLNAPFHRQGARAAAPTASRSTSKTRSHPTRKDGGRAASLESAAALAAQGVEVVVRINRPWRLAIRRSRGVGRPQWSAITLPKVPNAAHVRAVGEILDELELAERGLRRAIRTSSP